MATEVGWAKRMFWKRERKAPQQDATQRTTDRPNVRRPTVKLNSHELADCISAATKISQELDALADFVESGKAPNPGAFVQTVATVRANAALILAWTGKYPAAPKPLGTASARRT